MQNRQQKRKKEALFRISTKFTQVFIYTHLDEITLTTNNKHK